MQIVENKAKCRQCGDIIISKYNDRYEYCNCGAIAVCGGSEKILRLGHHIDIIEMSVKTRT